MEEGAERLYTAFHAERGLMVEGGAERLEAAFHAERGTSYVIMYKHPYFDLWLHDDDELRALLEEPVCERETLHEWPLSCVQQLTLASGRTLIYKAQVGPTCEPEFYAAARSPLLVSARTVWRQGGYVCMVLAKAPGNPLSAEPLDAGQAVDWACKLTTQIQQIEGDLPVYLDVGSETQWRGHVQWVAATLRTLIASELFMQTTNDAVDHLLQAAQAPTVIDVLLSDVGYVHGDLTAENVIVDDAAAGPTNLRVIDWQRPLRGPTGLDLYRLLTSLGHDPQPYSPPGLQTVDCILRIGWLTECAARWFQPGASGYDVQIAQLIEKF